MFDFENMRFSLYGIWISSGVLIAYGVSLYLAKKLKTLLHRDYSNAIDGALLWMLIPAVVCARLLFVLYHPDYFSVHPEEIVAVWHGGWVWHGALAGGLIGLFFYCKKNNLSFLRLLDLCTPGVVLGQAIGRWGNFFNQEAYGFPTHLPWGIPIDLAHRARGFEAFTFFHPTFLYESTVDVFIFLFLVYLLFRCIKAHSVFYEGMIFFSYLLLYSIGRFCIELLRIDSVPIIAGLRAPQWLSLILIVISLIWFARLCLRRNVHIRPRALRKEMANLVKT